MDKCVIKNRGASVVTYRIPEEGIRRSFRPGESKQIAVEELEKLMYQPGGAEILTQFLQIMDEQVVSSLNIHNEPEYYMSEADVVKLVKDGSLDAFLDALDFSPVSVVDLIKKISVDMPLLDLNKRKALKEKTGLDVEAAIKHRDEEKEDDVKITPPTAERRVKAEEAPAAPTGRRTTAPKFNIPTKAEKSE